MNVPLFLQRFPSTSPLKPIPSPAKGRKRSSFSDKEGFFKFKSFKKQDKETQVCVILVQMLFIVGHLHAFFFCM